MTAGLVDERMSDVDALVWAAERDPRSRTTIAALARFDGPLDFAALRHRVDRASRVIPRLRQRVVENPLGIAPPRWSLDPDFRLAFHLRRLVLGEATDARLLRVVRDLIVQPFDRAHPLWEFTVIEGLAEGGSAMLLKSHHSVSDGVGGVEMMLELFDLDAEPDPSRDRLPSPPAAAPVSHNPINDAIRHETGRTLHAVARSIDAVVTPRSLDEVATGARRLGESLGSAFRMFGPTAPRVVPASRSDGLDLRCFSVSLDTLRAAGRRVDGSINDAFITAVAIGAMDHHREHASDCSLRVGVPINTRSEGDGAGNHWTPGRIDLDLASGDEPDEVAAQVRRKMRRLRDEPAHDLLRPLAAGIRRLPSAATASLVASLSSRLDVAASNVPGSPIPLHLCGREVTALVPFGPLSGCAVNVTLLSHAGTAHVGLSSDPAAIDDPDGLARDIRSAFTSVVKGS